MSYAKLLTTAGASATHAPAFIGGSPFGTSANKAIFGLNDVCRGVGGATVKGYRSSRPIPSGGGAEWMPSGGPELARHDGFADIKQAAKFVHLR